LRLIGHSRGGGYDTMQYVLAKGRVQAAVVHSSGYALAPAARAADFTARFSYARHRRRTDRWRRSQHAWWTWRMKFEAAARQHGKPVEARYYAGGTHGSFFTNPAQHAAELRDMIAFLRSRLGS
jgi:hypothetical protein